MQGFQEAQQRLQQQQQQNSSNNNADMLNSVSNLQHQQDSFNLNSQQDQQPQFSFGMASAGMTPAMLLPNQPFGTLSLPQGTNNSASGTSNPGDGNPNQSFDWNAQFKQFQQIQQQMGAPNNNALLFQNTDTSSSPSMGGSGSTNAPFNQAAMQNQALLQSMIEQQKMQQQGNSMVGAPGVGGFNPMFAQPGLLRDARLLLAQSQLGGMVQGQNNSASEMPLPSPHSLFHRDGSRRMRGGVIEPFPEKLHRLLIEVEAAGRSDVISFVANGRAFAIHKPDKFFKEIVPLYFRQSRLSSFKRQLNLYGFELINTGPSRGGYFHELFVKDRPEMCRRMRRVAVKVSSSKTDKAEVGDDTATADADTKPAVPQEEPEPQGEASADTADVGNNTQIFKEEEPDQEQQLM